MSDEIAEFAQGLAPAEIEPAPESPAAETPPAPSPEPTPAPEPAPVQAQPEPQPPAVPSGHVPIDAMLSEREKRQSAERRLAELEAQRQPVQPPSVYDDPEGFQAYQQQQIAAVERKTTANLSQRFAEKQYGRDTVEQAARWYQEEYARTDPTAIQRLQADADPFDLVVRQHRQHQLLAKLGDVSTPEEAFQRWATEQGYVKADAVQAAPLQPAPLPTQAPKSINSAPSAGGAAIVPTGPLAAFEALPLRN